MPLTPPPYHCPQFHLDAPRLAVYRNGDRIDNQATESFASDLYEWALSHHYTDPQQQVMAWCTQSALAPLYKRRHWEMIQDHIKQPFTLSPYPTIPHLVDDGVQQVTLDDQSGAVHIQKPFRILCEPDTGGEGDRISPPIQCGTDTLITHHPDTNEDINEDTNEDTTIETTHDSDYDYDKVVVHTTTRSNTTAKDSDSAQDNPQNNLQDKPHDTAQDRVPQDMVIVQRIELHLTLSPNNDPILDWVDVPLQPYDQLSANGNLEWRRRAYCDAFCKDVLYPRQQRSNSHHWLSHHVSPTLPTLSSLSSSVVSFDHIGNIGHLCTASSPTSYTAVVVVVCAMAWFGWRFR